MREKLAKALDSADVHSVGWKERAIDAVLDALREPTPEMVDDGMEELDTCLNVDPCGKAAVHCWRTMLNAAAR